MTMRVHKTDKEFKADVKQLVGNKYTVMTHYINTRTPVEMRHNVCKQVFSIKPGNFLYGGQRCPHCAHREAVARRIARNGKRFAKRVKKLYGSEYTILGKYINMHTAVKVRHNKCGTVYDTVPEFFLNKEEQCPKCYTPANKKGTTASFKKQVHNLVGDHYTVLSKYKTNYKPVWMRHNDCGNVFKMRPYAFVRIGERCPHCSSVNAQNGRRLTADKFQKLLHKYAGNEYTVVGKVQGSHIPTFVKDSKGKMHHIAPTSLLSRLRKNSKK